MHNCYVSGEKIITLLFRISVTDRQLQLQIILNFTMEEALHLGNGNYYYIIFILNHNNNVTVFIPYGLVKIPHRSLSCLHSAHIIMYLYYVRT